jgi:phospholipase/carboxylesterase
MLLLHGWTGDETVMWIFARKVPSNYWLFAPRAPLTADIGGYAWLPHTGSWPRLVEFETIAGELAAAFQRWAKNAGAPDDVFDVMGFSQGAAMAYALGAYLPQQIGRIAALAGFLPEDTRSGQPYPEYSGKEVYIAHGNRDNIVPVKKAEEAVQTLQNAGAAITYCASDVAHKLSVDCLHGLGEFFEGKLGE